MLLASYFLKERTNMWQKLSLLLSVTGVVYIFIMKGIGNVETSFIGIFLILLSAFSSSSYNVLARKMMKKFNVFDLTYMMTFIGFLSFNTIAVVNHIQSDTVRVYFEPFANATFLMAILYLGILSSFLTAFLSNYALRHMAASKMSVFSNLSTLITIIAGVVFLQEEIAYYHIIGAIMIILGVIGTNILDEKGISVMTKKPYMVNKK